MQKRLNKMALQKFALNKRKRSKTKNSIRAMVDGDVATARRVIGAGGKN